jgi:hypothetical protein
MSSVSTNSNPGTPMGSKRLGHQNGTMEQHMLDGEYCNMNVQRWA